MNSPRRFMFIINPFSGGKDKTLVKNQITSHLQGKNVDFEIVETLRERHAHELAREALDNYFETIVAVGGDGTVNEVASALINTKAKLGIICGGSGNGFARNLGMFRPIASALDVILANKTVDIDVCYINDSPYFNVAGIGIDATVAYRTKLNPKRGLWPYVIESLKARNEHSIQADLIVDGKPTSGKYKVIVVANAPLYGYNFAIAPLADITDGKLDIMLFKDKSVLHYLKEFPKFINATLHQSSIVTHIKADHLRVHCSQPQHYHVDGEGKAKEFSTFEFTIQPKSLKVITP